MTLTAVESPAIQLRAIQYYQAATRELAGQVDQMMAWLLGLEWVGMVITACLQTPFTWEGATRHWNPHSLAALLSGPAFIGPCIMLAIVYPGRVFTRHSIAVAQMLVSVILIGITHGRIETHFHVFGSLAFLAAYRDWRVLVTASAVAAADHFLRGIWWPQAIYGVVAINPYRWLEHVWWVVFEDFFLLLAISRATRESKEVARGKSMLYEGAYHDVLTGLANRRQLSENFAELIKSRPSSSHAVLFVDLDRFKQVNDVHGHGVGDKLLLQVAGRLTHCLTGPNTLARIGGDEFIVLLSGADSAETAGTGALLLQAITEPFSIDGFDLLLSATIGIALYPAHGSELGVLQERADQAMYLAKAGGRNQVQVYSEDAARKKDQAEELARDLFEAQSKGQLHLHFQPLVGSNGEVLKFETLLRWNHPKYGSIPPGEFIPVAERSGLIVAMGDWVLVQACRECRSWQKQYTSALGVAVNVSARQFEHPGFPARVKAILNETELNPTLLTLELTENSLCGNLGQVHEHLRVLRAIGVNVALDDFGTGYSSLSYLSQLPADSIKLDRSFVQHEFSKGSSVVESVIQMAHRIGLRVVAEGVESQAEVDWLKDLQCDEFQGYKFSRPIPAALVLQYLAGRFAETREVDEEAIAC